MVSFSCDVCQDVVTKPKVRQHMARCGGARVSCLDCQRMFDERSVGGHKSCISEAEKYGPSSNATGGNCTSGVGTAPTMTQTYCGACCLPLNGAVHAVQHYDSKKHKACMRKLGSGAKKGAEAGGDGDSKGEDALRKVNVRSQAIVKGSDIGRRKEVVKRRMTSVIVEVASQPSRKGGIDLKKLVVAIEALLGEDKPHELAQVVAKKVSKSSLLRLENGRIRLETK